MVAVIEVLLRFVLYMLSVLTGFWGLCRNGFGADELGSEILSIALPAALALAADPITSLVDTAFVGHLGTLHFDIYIYINFNGRFLLRKTGHYGY